jgi:hypothetical protein
MRNDGFVFPARRAQRVVGERPIDDYGDEYGDEPADAERRTKFKIWRKEGF